MFNYHWKWILIYMYRVAININVSPRKATMANLYVTYIACGTHQWSPISLVSHLIVPQIRIHATPIPLVPPYHWSPTYWSPIPLIPPSYCSPNHWSPNPQYIIWPHWCPILLVPWPIGPPSHWSSISLVPSLLPPPPPPPQLIAHCPPLLNCLRSLLPISLGHIFISPPSIDPSQWPPSHCSSI